MNIISFLGKFFGRDAETDTSKSVAKQRLRLVLVHDRLDVSETIMNSLREDLIATIDKYMEIDREALEVSLSREEDGVALVANIPVLNVKRQPDSTGPVIHAKTTTAGDMKPVIPAPAVAKKAPQK